jgi:hypothetical protein
MFTELNEPSVGNPFDVHLDALSGFPDWRAEADDSQCDIYLSFSGSPRMQFAGFLVTEKGNPDALIAYCPMQPGVRVHGKKWRREVVRQLRIAIRLATCPQDAEDTVDAIYLGWIAGGEKPVPNWVYGLNCTPLKENWNGNFLHPRPFCPSLFECMASRPQAVQWLKREQAKRAAGAAS